MFRVFGIQLSLHVSFFLLLAYFAFEGWKTGGVEGAAWSVLLIILFFGCVVLHELGHSLTAMRYGVRVPRILLMPIGGMAEMDHIPRKPSAELWITIMGPAVNFAIVLMLLPVIWNAQWFSQRLHFQDFGAVVALLAQANLLMGLFNLLPVFPMDGGRILRALLATRMPHLRATYWAATSGKVLAGAFALIAFFYFNKPLLGALFLFIFYAGDAEYRQVLIREREAAYQAEFWRRVAAMRARDVTENEPPEPPIIMLPPR